MCIASQRQYATLFSFFFFFFFFFFFIQFNDVAFIYLELLTMIIESIC